MSFTVLGTGSALPAFVLDNARLEQMVDTSDEWITTRTGMKARHICMEETLTDLASAAAQGALAQAGIEAGALDLILCATVQGDMVTPSLACLVQREIGAACPAMDINAACTGFLYALDVAAAYFARGTVRHVLVLAAEAMSRHVDWTERANCVLFGDGAGAVVLSAGEDLRAMRLHAQGDARHLYIPGTKGRFPDAPARDPREGIYMNGQEVYRFAVQAMCRRIEEALEAAGVTMGDVRYVLAHQANKRILDAASARLGVPPEKMVVRVDRLGNTSSASIPLMLDDVNRAGMLQKGDLLVLCAFGGGLTSGAGVLRWGEA